MSESNFDKRIVSRKVTRGDIKQEDYDQFLNEMEDCSDLSDEVETKFVRKVENKGTEEEFETE